MLKRRLGNRAWEVPALGLGAWALGGGTDWGPTAFTDVVNTVSAALESGISLIDTAPIYGDSEAVLGRALAGKRSQVILSTKCGLVKNGSWTDHDLRPETITRQLENSLQNLRTDYIDLYFIHYLDPKVPWQEAWQTLTRLKAQGKVRVLGVCNVPPEVLVQMAQTGELNFCVASPKRASRVGSVPFIRRGFYGVWQFVWGHFKREVSQRAQFAPRGCAQLFL